MKEKETDNLQFLRRNNIKRKETARNELKHKKLMFVIMKEK